MTSKIFQILSAGLLMAAAHMAPASAAVLFSDNFDDGDVSDWTIVTNYQPAFSLVDVSTQAVSAPYSLQAHLLAGGGSGNGGTNLYVNASRDFTLASDFSDIVLSFSGLAATCSGCTMHYRAFIDGDMVGDYTDNVFTLWNVDLAPLSAGVHTLMLGMFTNVASSGDFYARFDNVSITGNAVMSAVPETASWAMMIIGFGLVGVALRRRRADQYSGSGLGLAA